MRDNGMQRREFITTTAAASLAAGLGTNALGTQASTNATSEATSGDFTLDYAPHFGMFNHHAGNDMIDQIDFMAEAGFCSIEDNGMRGRSSRTAHRRWANERQHGRIRHEHGWRVVPEHHHRLRG